MFRAKHNFIILMSLSLQRLKPASLMNRNAHVKMMALNMLSCAPLIGSCGSGVTSSVLALALAHAGRPQLMECYDGSASCTRRVASSTAACGDLPTGARRAPSPTRPSRS